MAQKARVFLVANCVVRVTEASASEGRGQEAGGRRKYSSSLAPKSVQASPSSGFQEIGRGQRFRGVRRRELS
ncbi:hypothetical protein [Gloeothece citriformis]|uniref:hypothetical protein n=1 Tax=Gloeothece citriformis TaxID=2546356 RepID=UPI0003000B3B|nr:hypothetical protein [Gloeothece citriformis]